MGHTEAKGLHDLHNKCITEGISYCSFDFDFCEHCVYSNQNRVSFPFGSTREKGILELIHSIMSNL